MRINFTNFPTQRIALLSSVAMIWCMLSSCGSLVYSPAMMLSKDIAAKEQTQCFVAGAMMPETLPTDTSSALHGGLLGGVRYQFQERFSLQAKYWSDLDHRGGCSMSALFNSPSDFPDHTIIHAELGFAYDQRSINGWGMALRYGRTGQFKDVLGYFVAAGPMFGFNDFGKVSNGEWGAGVLTHFGLSANIATKLDISAEICLGYQYNHASHGSNLYVSPTAGLILNL